MTKITPELWMKSWDSHVKTESYPKESLGVLFTREMAKFPSNIACWMMDREITYGELLEDVQRFATFLQENGVQKGDVVAISLANCPQYIIAHVGTLLAGCVASGLNPLLSPKEIAYQLNDSKAKVMVTLDAIYEKVLSKKLDEIPALDIVVATNISEYMGFSKLKVFLGKKTGKIPHGKIFDWPGKKVVKFSEVMSVKPDVKPITIDVDQDLACLQYTGGTTGFPKGTELTHANLNAMYTIFANWLNLEPGTTLTLSAFPMFHAAGLTVMSESIWLAGSQVLIANPRDIGLVIQKIIDRKPTIVANVPTLFGMIMNHPKSKEIPDEVLDNIRVYISGAAPFPGEMIRDFETKMKASNKVMELYGMTETSPVCVSNPILGKKKVGKVGLPLPDTELKLINIETGEAVETGEPGEILVRGPIVTRGYYNKPEATAETIESDGWLHTGDVGVMDEDGYIQIVDRVKDMLIVSGYKVYSVHVEDVLTKHPDIAMVAIIGMDDPDRPGSEIVHAYVQLKGEVEASDSVKESIKKYADENLSKYEKPRVYEFREELPLTTVGKVLKRVLKEK
ncbi:MAG: AMP-binding protein [Candidatus Hodarchaeales archaeon]|jgi:long-chain acyl-CoA synthetase